MRRASILRLTVLTFIGMAGVLRGQDCVVNTAPAAAAPDTSDAAVLVRGTITCVQGSRFYVQDATQAWTIYSTGPPPAVSPGDVVEVECEKRGIRQTQVLSAVRITKKSSVALPEPENLTIQKVLGGERTNRRVRVKGSVHDVTVADNRMLLLVDDEICTLSVIVPVRPDAPFPENPFELLDAVVEVTGISLLGTKYDQSDRLWANMPVNSIADVRVIEPGHSNVFEIPLQSLADVQEEPASEFGKRKRVMGKVTYASGSGWFYIQDEAGFTARARKPDFYPPSNSRHRDVHADTNLSIGDVIDMVGQVPDIRVTSNLMPWFVQCEWRVLRHEGPPAYSKVDPNDLFDPKFDGKPVSVAGWITGISVSDDPNGYVNHYLNLGGISALVQLREKIDLPVKEGAAVRVKGTVKASYSRSGLVTNVRINVQSFDDVRVIPFAMDRNSFIKGALITLGCLVLAALWIVVLRRQVRRQTAKMAAVNDELLRFKQVAEASTDFIAMATLENKPLYMNPAGRALLGIAPDADIGAISYEETSTPQGRELIAREGFPRAFEHGHWQAELNMRKLSGEEVPVSFLGLIIKSPDGRPQYLASVARDISERHALETRLRESNNELLRFKAIADNMSDLVAMAELDRTPIYINAAGRTLLGIGADEDARSIDFESIYTPESVQLFEREGFAHAFEHGHWSAEVTLRHRDGHDVPVVFSGLVLRKADGSPLCMSCIAHDLTHRIALENQLRASLEHERELNALKSGFVNTISHEFRTPLGIILFASSMMRRFNETFSTEERAAQLDAIDESVERMNELVEQSLSLGRAEVAAPKKSTFDARKFAARVIDEVMSSTSRRSPITLETADPLPAAHCDEMMLRTILANLLGNAVKYSPAGSPITLRVEQRDADTATFTIRDHGRGLDADDLPKLFTTFHRGKGVEGIPGSGLGLAIVKRCVEALEGSVTARNAPDDGAEFVVTIPLFKTSS